MFITGDTGSCGTINEVKAAGHNILVAFIEGNELETSSKIKSAEKFYWEWRDFLSWTPEAISAKERKAQRKAQWLQKKAKQRGKGSHDKKMRKEKRRKEKKKNGADCDSEEEGEEEE